MKTATPELKALLLTRDFIWLDLYTFELANGTVIRLSGGDRLIRAAAPGIELVDGPHTYSIGVPISDSGVKASIGLGVNGTSITMFAGGSGSYTFNGQPLQQFIRARGFVGAKIRIDRAYAKTWGDMATLGAVGTINRLYGLYAGAGAVSATQAVIKAVPMTFLLNSEMPSDIYQINCANQLYDNKCTLSQASFTTTGTFGSGSTVTALVTSLSNPATRYSQGKITFTSGANNGQIRTVKDDDGSGHLTLVQPLASAPASGDTFSISYGCDLTWATCGSKFSNQVHFRGQTKIPTPESAL